MHRAPIIRYTEQFDDYILTAARSILDDCDCDPDSPHECEFVALKVETRAGVFVDVSIDDPADICWCSIVGVLSHGAGELQLYERGRAYNANQIGGNNKAGTADELICTVSAGEGSFCIRMARGALLQVPIAAAKKVMGPLFAGLAEDYC